MRGIAKQRKMKTQVGGWWWASRPWVWGAFEQDENGELFVVVYGRRPPK